MRTITDFIANQIASFSANTFCYGIPKALTLAPYLLGRALVRKMIGYEEVSSTENESSNCETFPSKNDLAKMVNNMTVDFLLVVAVNTLLDTASQTMQDQNMLPSAIAIGTMRSVLFGMAARYHKSQTILDANGLTRDIINGGVRTIFISESIASLNQQLHHIETAWPIEDIALTLGGTIGEGLFHGFDHANRAAEKILMKNDSSNHVFNRIKIS